jgi:hypothetical protein
MTTVEEIPRSSVVQPDRARRSDWAGDHVGRAFVGHEPEDVCPCPKAPCGLVVSDEIRTDCPAHHDARSMRQSHSVKNCSGAE